MWTVHSYEGDYNQLHDHDVSYGERCMAFSVILYCKVPPQILELGKSTNLYHNGGATDGCTYFIGVQILMQIIYNLNQNKTDMLCQKRVSF